MLPVTNLVTQRNLNELTEGAYRMKICEIDIFRQTFDSRPVLLRSRAKKKKKENHVASKKRRQLR